ncbi:MAG: sulfur carrier protein ThiS [Oscillospiraceae bacterium]|nr:sulfur carrier protein ThiS [Oscillospiraceae bacterium]
MKINSEIIDLEKPVNLKQLLVDMKYNIARIAVEKNGEIVPRSTYESVTVSDEDTLEVVSFVGGG